MRKLRISGKLLAMVLALEIVALGMLLSASSAAAYYVVISRTSGTLEAPYPGGAYIKYSATYYSYFGKPFVTVRTTLYCPLGIPKSFAYVTIRSESPIAKPSTEEYDAYMDSSGITHVRSYGYTYRGTIEWGVGEYPPSGGLPTGYNTTTWRYR